MKKLYRKGSVHPSLPLVSDHLTFLPATILTLSAALSPEDREVLAYLISCSSGGFSGNRSKTRATRSGGGGKGGVGGGDHPPSFGCNCFRCYTSYWVRWDLSPNRQLIHEIIDVFEGDLVQSQTEKGRKERRNKRGSKGSDESKRSSGLSQGKDELGKSESSVETNGGGLGEVFPGGGSAGDGEDREEGSENGSVRRFVSFLGERFWSVWT